MANAMVANAMVANGRRLEPVFDSKYRQIGTLEYVDNYKSEAVCQVAWVSDKPGARQLVEEACRMRGGNPEAVIRSHAWEEE